VKRLRDRLWIGAWLAPRSYWWLSAIATLFAASAAVRELWWVALLASGAFVVLLVADAVAGPGAQHVEVTRVAPDPLSLRHDASIRYRVRNGSSRTLNIGIVEAPCALLHYLADEVTLHVPPASEAESERRVMPVARGTAQLDRFFYWYENGFAMLRRRRRFAMPQEVRVYPDLSAVERYGTLHARNRLIEAGLRRMRLRGAGTELESLREWTPGDAFRTINWKATARRGHVMVAQYEVERSQNVMILLDAGRLMTPRVDEQRKFDYAITAAMSVASIAALANDKVGIVAFASDILHAYAPRSSGRSLSHLAGEVHGLEPRFEESDYDRAFAYVRTHVHKRSLVIFFTDMVDPVAQSAVLAQIGTLARRHLVVCVFMNDAAIDRALEQEPHAVTDVFATGVALELREERLVAAAALRRLGVQVIDVPAHDLTTALIDRYLQIKQRGLL
jgi:uncharacterized protein (DUF58 family)